MTAPAFPRLAAAVLGWHQRAACRHADPGLFFGPDGENDDARRRRETRAGHICAGCPVLASCAEWAREHEPRAGIWGGVNHDYWAAGHRRASDRARKARQREVAA